LTGDIINLRKFRKDKTRSEKEKTAETNRAKFGMSKAEKQKTQSEKEQIARIVDGAKLNSKKDETE
jgi:hypothetical protein